MEDLIKALQIFAKYADLNDRNPLHCSHDQLTICAGVTPENVSEEDVISLDALGFFVNEQGDCFISFRFGSC
jgi:hypothetical protein